MCFFCLLYFTVMKRFLKYSLIIVAAVLLFSAINTLVFNPRRENRILTTTPAISATVTKSKKTRQRALIPNTFYSYDVKYLVNNKGKSAHIDGVELSNEHVASLLIHEDPEDPSYIVVEGESHWSNLSDGISMLITCLIVLIIAMRQEIIGFIGRHYDKKS